MQALRSFALIWLCVSALPCFLNASQQTSTSFAGVELSVGEARLLQKVQSVYGQSVMALDDSTLPDSTLAEATLGFDGVPTVKVNPRTGRHEAQIAHELMHLLGWADGVPWLHFVSVSDVGNEGPATVNFLVNGVYDQVFHAYFYPKIRELGIDPALEERNGIREYLSRGFPTASGYLLRANLALYYFRCVVVLQDQPLAQELASAFALGGQEDAVKMGKEMVSAVESEPITKPSDVTSAFLRCAKIATAGHFQLSLWCIRPVRRGRVRQQIAIVAIEPQATPSGITQKKPR